MSGPPETTRTATDRERLHALLDSLTDDRLALAEKALTALAMPDGESVINADRDAITASELDPKKIGHALAAYRQSQGWTHDDLAAFLGVTLRQLADLSGATRPLIRNADGIWSPGSGIYALAEAHGADNHRLFEAITDRASNR